MLKVILEISGYVRTDQHGFASVISDVKGCESLLVQSKDIPSGIHLTFSDILNEGWVNIILYFLCLNWRTGGSACANF